MKLGFLKQTVDIKKYTDLSLVEEAAKRLNSGRWLNPCVDGHPYLTDHRHKKRDPGREPCA